jgi:hypothetical protein
MDPKYAGLGGDLASVAGGLFGMGMKNPGDAGINYLNQIPNTIKPYFQPYMDAGKSMIPGLESQYSQLVNNPGLMMNQFGQGYQQSPGFKFQVDQATRAANNAAAAGGMVGSPMEQQTLAGTVNNLANQDYWDYLNQVLGMYGHGLNGMSHMYDSGLMASSDLANGLAQALSAQAQMAYNGQMAQNKSNSDSIGGIIGGIGKAASLFGF